MAIQFEPNFIRHIGTFGRSESGWTKEVNIISWNGNGAKVDVRSWSPDKQKSSKIGTMSIQEALRLAELLLTLDDGVMEIEPWEEEA